MKRKSILIAIIGAITTGLFSCGDSGRNHVTVVEQPQYQQSYQQQQPQNVVVQTSANTPAGFSVQNFAGLLQQTADPNALTQAINVPENNINHLDLDGDGAVDYLRVDQIGDNSLVVVDELSQTQRANICTLTVNNNTNSYSVVGNPDYCGNTYIYNSPTGLTLSQYAFLSWWFAPTHYRHYYHPTWGYHTAYYGGYRPYRPRTGLYTNREVTRTRTIRTTTTTTPKYRTQQQTPKYNTQPQTPKYNTQPQQVVKTPVAPPPPRNIPSVSNPTASQKQYNANEGNRYKAANTNNVFKTAAPAYKAPTPAYKPASSTYKPSSNYGGGRSNFGAGRKK